MHNFFAGLVTGGILAGVGVWICCADKIKQAIDDRDWYQRICAGLEGVNKDLNKMISKLLEIKKHAE